MPKWSEYKKIAKERGALAFELFIVESRPAGTPEAIQATLPAHLAYQKEMEKAGILFLAGPVSDVSGDLMDGTGMIIYRAKDMAAARGIADRDPMHISGARMYSLRKWLVNEGQLNLSVRLSEQKFTLA